LDRHVQTYADKTDWTYRWGVGSRGENAATLHSAIMAALAIGIAITQLLEDSTGNAEFAVLSERFQAMPPAPTI
jgi:hypothetical protein